MDHAEARELLELGAVEPGGFDRLMAGDTPAAAALAGHLAVCPDCRDELARLRTAATVIREVVRSTPPADLRERTLGFVRVVGRDRAPATISTQLVAPTTLPSGADATTVRPTSRGRRVVLGWAAGIAAALVIGVAATAMVVGGRGDAAVAARDAQLRAQADVVTALSRVTTWTLRIDSQPDVRRIPLASSNGTGASGTLAFSPASGELVVVASGLAEPPQGHEFRCWFDADGERRLIGKMFFGGGLAYWVGHVDELGQLPPDSSFGVSMVEIGGDPGSGPPVLSGTL